jgi:hypothetical protein
MKAAHDDLLCKRVGAGPDTSDYAECRAIIAADRDAKQTRALNALMGIGLAAMAAPPPAPVMPPRSFDCSVRGMGRGNSEVSCQ